MKVRGVSVLTLAAMLMIALLLDWGAAWPQQASADGASQTPNSTQQSGISPKSIPIPPVAEFSASPRSGGYPLTVSFRNLSESANSFQWDFGDGRTSKAKDPTHTYTKPGYYTVSLRAVNQDQTDTETKSNYIFAKPPNPTARFSASPVSGTAPLKVSFQNSSSNATSYQWSFGDGEESEQVEPSHKYLEPGKYTVTLKAINIVNTSVQKRSKYITVKEVVPMADFTASPTSGVPPLEVSFKNKSKNAASYVWDFGDGSKSSAANPVHTYSRLGQYTVKLTAKDNGKSDTKTKSDYISAAPLPPKAGFTASPRNGRAPLTVQFNNTSQNATSYSWKFGDGGKSNEKDPTHQYKKAGTFDVTLVAGNGDLKDTRTAKGYISATAVPPKAGFTASPRSGRAPLTVQFNNTSQNATSYSWKFGDGGKSNEKDPTHQYKKVGTFDVTLVAGNGDLKDTRTAKGCITVKAVPPQAAFKGSPRTGSVPLTVAFQSTSTNAATYAWDFGNGQTSSEKDPVCTYNVTGSYTVKLTVTSSEGKSNTTVAANYITVTPVPPVADFVGTPRSGTKPLTVNFINTSTNAASYLWDFGDGGSSQLPSPDHTYQTVGTYTVKLTVSKENLVDTKIATDYVTVSEPAPPTAAFTGSPREGAAPLTVYFVSTSVGAQKHLWDFGDGGGSQDTHPYHTYSQSGEFTVTLTVSNGEVTDTITKSKYVNVTEVVRPKADFQANPLSGTKPLSVIFTNKSEGATSYLWDFGDDTTSTEEHPTHQYTQSGAFTVKLTATNGSLSDSKTQPGYITVTDPVQPSADFEGTPRTGYPPLTVNFINTSSGATGFLWDFGDGTSSKEEGPTHEFKEAGSYTIALTARNGAQTDTLARPDYVVVLSLPAPAASFTGSPLTGSKPVTVSFSNTSTNASSYLWTFGDGGTSTEKNPVHSFAEPGLYSVALTAINGDMKDTLLRTDYVTVTEIPPVAGFTATPLTGNRPLTVNFLNTSSNAEGYLWDFGDGGTSIDPSPSHSYSTAGSFTVKLTAKNGALTNTATRESYIIVSDPILPTADFTGSPTSGTKPLTVSFTNISTNATSYRWEFGDGGSSADKNPIHQFTATGSFTVSLTATNGDLKNTVVKPNYVTIADVAPKAEFQGTPLSGTRPLKVSFLNTSTNATDYQWDFGDGGSSSDASPTHDYTTTGSFAVKLTAKNGGLTDTVTKAGYVTVSDPAVPTVEFSGAPTTGSKPLTVSFTNTSTNATSFYWDFGDGTSSSEKEPAHQYNNDGTYSVSLTASNGDVKKTKTQANYITVTIGVKADFTAAPLSGTKPLTVMFSNLSKNASEDGYLWDFGDGSSDTKVNPEHEYKNAGTYTVTLTARNGSEWDSLAKPSFISVSDAINPTAGFIGSPLGSATAPLTVDFTNTSSNATAYLWTFGDGGTSTLVSPSHTFDLTGSFTVSLTASNGAKSDTLTMPDYIIIGDPRHDVETEPNDDESQANILRPSIPMTGQIMKTGSSPDVDYFWIQTAMVDLIPVLFTYRFFNQDEDYCNRYHISVWNSTCTQALLSMPIYVIEEQKVSFSFAPLPSDTFPADYYVRVEPPVTGTQPDPDICVLHLNEPYTITVSFPEPSRPEIPRISRLSTPWEVKAGQTITVRIGLKNDGAMDAEAFTISLFLCTGRKIDPEHDLLLRRIEVDYMASMVAFQKSVTLRIPDNIEPGIYTIGALVDAPGVASEIDAVNEAISSSRELKITQ